MSKINIVKPTGSEALSLVSAFKADNNTYLILDNEKMGSMGLPVIFISKLTDKLEKINDDNEWQNVKNYLKGIINGTSFEYVSVPDVLNADETFYKPLSLPQESFDLIKNRYVVKEEVGAKVLDVMPTVEAVNAPIVEPAVVNPAPVVPNVEANVVPPTPNVVSVDPSIINPTPIETPQVENVTPAPSPVAPPTPEVIPPATPIIPDVNAASNASVATNNPIPEVPSNVTPIEPNPTVSANPSFDSNLFVQDKETFLKACENMFDALITKYQKQITDIETKEKELKQKELEIDMKLKNANEHLANAEAREQVANIAHDNAQKVMDLTSMMPNNPTPPAGVA